MKVAGVSSEDQLLPELAEQQPVFPIEIKPDPALHPAAAAVHRGAPGEGAGAARHRPAVARTRSIIQTIQDREYVVQKDRRFYATMLGIDRHRQADPGVPRDHGRRASPPAWSGSSTRSRKQHLDWIKLLAISTARSTRSSKARWRRSSTPAARQSPYKCDKCGSADALPHQQERLLPRLRRTASAAHTQPVDEQGKPTVREVSEHKCPDCGREMIKRRGRFGEFLGCSGYSVKNEKGEPSCSTIINLDKEGNPLPPKPPPIKTTVDVREVRQRRCCLRDGKRGPFLGCSNVPEVPRRRR